jgi:hypothetical protein
MARGSSGDGAHAVAGSGLVRLALIDLAAVSVRGRAAAIRGLSRSRRRRRGLVELPYYDLRRVRSPHGFMVESTLDWHPRVNGYSDYAPPAWRVDARGTSPASQASVFHRCPPTSSSSIAKLWRAMSGRTHGSRTFATTA